MKERRKRIPGVTKERYGGIKLQTLNIIMIVVVILVSVALLIGIDLLTDTYHQLKTTTDEYVSCQDDARDMMEASDYLTNQARAFAVTGDVEYMENYFAESKQVKRRDNALENLENYMPESKALEYLRGALRESVALMDTEYYSMRLVCSAKGYDMTTMPEEIRNIRLTSRDRDLSPEKKMAKAIDLMYNEAYQKQKRDISSDVQSCLKQLVKTIETKENDNFRMMEKNMHRVSILIGVMMFLFLALIVLIITLIVRPLENNIDFINSKAHLPLKGAFELQYLAYVYNRMYDENKEQSDRLAFEAIHDRLTGAYNRAGFEERLQGSNEETITLVLLDIDRFKEINDNHGHAVGDLVLKQVVRLIEANFRQEDYVCRIGGDEFAIIMLFTDHTARNVIEEKFHIINEQLLHPNGSIPASSLSAGVAFCDRNDPSSNMFRDADEALYDVKKAGRNGIRFYGEK